VPAEFAQLCPDEQEFNLYLKHRAQYSELTVIQGEYLEHEPSRVICLASVCDIKLCLLVFQQKPNMWFKPMLVPFDMVEHFHPMLLTQFLFRSTSYA
jgi:hypothetical protein